MLEGGALALRTGAVIAATVAGAVALALTLSFLKFDQKLLDVTAGRLGVVAAEVARQGELGMTLGLDLTELEDLGAVAARSRDAAGVSGIAIIDIDGRVLHAADPARVGSQVTFGDRRRASTVERRLVEGDTIGVSLPLRNAFGQLAGAVIVTASLERLRAEEAAVRESLIKSATPVIAAALLVTGLAVRLTIAWSVRQGRQMADAAVGVEDDAEAPVETVQHLHETLEPRLAQSVAVVERALDRVERALDEHGAPGDARPAGGAA